MNNVKNEVFFKIRSEIGAGAGNAYVHNQIINEVRRHVRTEVEFQIEDVNSMYWKIRSGQRIK
jgi:hypothetical protein